MCSIVHKSHRETCQPTRKHWIGMAPTIPCPAKQSAIVANQQGNLVISHDVPFPEIRPDMLLVKTAAVDSCRCEAYGTACYRGRSR
ncbi:hypothetical protein GGR58DRAFT_376527 [Xylaria digitata]|nr:hypothetical protein GGR58DRAFT_376527 [Xylaria digitata]